MADMADMLKNFSSMMEGKEIPDNIKEMLNSFTNNSNDSTNTDNHSNFNSNNGNSDATFNNTSDSNQSSSMPNIDIETMVKLQKIMSAMNSNSNSSGANLLRSLKPYLKPSRQAKVDEYIQLLNIEKVIGLMNSDGGDKK